MFVSRKLVALVLTVSFAVTQNQAVFADEQGVPREEKSIITKGDRLAIHIQNVLPGESTKHPLQVSIALGDRESIPAFLVDVNAVGELRLPLITELPIAGLTVAQAEKAISAIYEKEDILRKGSKIYVAIAPRLPAKSGSERK